MTKHKSTPYEDGDDAHFEGNPAYKKRGAKGPALSGLTGRKRVKTEAKNPSSFDKMYGKGRAKKRTAKKRVGGK